MSAIAQGKISLVYFATFCGKIAFPSPIPHANSETCDGISLASYHPVHSRTKIMRKVIALGFLGLLMSTGMAEAQTCAAVPFANGTTADANQLNNYLACLAPLANPLFTGNVGIGAVAPNSSLVINPGTNDTQLYFGLPQTVGFSGTYGAAIGTYPGSNGATLLLEPSAGLVQISRPAGGPTYLVLDNPDKNTYGVYLNSNGNSYFRNGNLGIGTTTPAQALEVHGMVQVDTFGSATALPVCELAGVLSSCSSSLRYKENVETAPFGLSEIEQMRPVTFKWKGRNETDFGLIAEEVAKINPLFVTYKAGKIEGVKYAQLTAVLVNAVQQLKSTSDKQAKTIASLQDEVASLLHERDAAKAVNSRKPRRLSERN